jgi:Protein of unknown function (DUF1588)/Protein of unknown function (DUF1592)/Protein of unknown function (DUF1595)/Protein of unknown function (DUF1587)
VKLYSAFTGCALGLAFGCGSADTKPSSAVSESRLLPAVRRLSSAELEAAASQILGVQAGFAQALPPDARQSDYSRNVAQSVDSLTLGQLFDASQAASDAIDLSQPGLPSCAGAVAVSDRACAASTLSALARLAFRHAPSAAEITQLLTLFDLGAEAADFRSGIALAVRGLLGSPKFLYATSLGDGSASTIRLRDDELATELAFLISGQPPDSELLDAAARGDLGSGPNRESQAIRLLRRSDSRYLYRRFVQEWLGIIGLNGLAKSSQVVTGFPALREAMLSETNQLVDDVFSQQGGSIAALLAGGYSFVPDGLASFYGIAQNPPGTRVALTSLGRVGILQQASFLATFAHESESAPVLRGKAVLTRLLCQDFPKPTDLGIDIVFPPANPNATTRERFDRHATDPLCSGCHAVLDGVGFGFENFDAAGQLRLAESERPLDTAGKVSLDGRELSFADSMDLSRALANSEQVRECAARQVVRFAAGQRDDRVEQAFVDSLSGSRVSAARRASLLGLFLEFVKSDWFAWRQPQ